jgi:Ca-activated chloride channel family protein
LGTLLAVVVAGLFIWGGVRMLSDVKRFGLPSAVEKLITSKTGGRRAFKASLTVLSVALAFVALAGPQYGRGTRLIPATNLDCVVVLDYSKSMYARDVAPSRTERAKAEVARLIQQLPGTRFGAVAFAGEPLSFPLTSDGGAIAQFFRQMTPNDMPVGGTAIARALESARELLARDPLSAKHQKVILLVTDGEDLEGDPVAVAKAANKDGVLVHVVQIGGRAPEPIPEVDEAGQVVGIRKDRSGKPITTALSAQGEAQLTQVAQSGGGNVVRAETGQTGLDEVTRSLKRFMTEELSERVETVYADVFHYPLILALLLLMVETFVPLASRGLKWGAALVALLGLGGCDRLDDALFMRYSPDVDDALANIASHDAGDAHAGLAEYLSTGRCKAGEIGTPDSLRELPQAAYDLGLALFELGERFGGKLGEPPKGNDPNAAALLAKRSREVDCALRVTRLVAFADANPIELRAKAFFLSGNLEFLRHDYKNAVSSYDDALRLIPGGLAADPQLDFGADAAFNRAIALRLEEEEEKNKPKPPDAGPQPPQDGGANSGDEDNEDQKQDDKKDQEQKEKEEEKKDEEKKGDQDKDKDKDKDQQEQSKDDQKQDQSKDEPKPEPSAQASNGTQHNPPPSSSGSNGQPTPAQAATGQPPSLSQDDRILEMLERAPMFQPVQPGQVRGRPGRLEDK